MTITYRLEKGFALTYAEGDQNFRDLANSVPISVKAAPFNAVGDGVTDDTAAIQAAIDAVNEVGGGNVFVPAGNYRCNIVLKDGVILVGKSAFGYRPGSIGGVTFTANAAGAVIDTPSAETFCCGVVGIDVAGLGAGTACKGIQFRNVKWGVIKEVNINNISDQGILVSDGVACTIEDVLAVNCLLDRTQAAKIGVVDIDGADHFLTRIESTASLSALSDANAYLCGISIRGDNMFLSDCIGEISDEGIHIVAGANLNRFSNCRADRNFGHGFHVIGQSNQFANCLALENSQETTNTYDNWMFANASGANQTVNCQAGNQTATVARYGFNDLVTSATAKNLHFNPVSFAAGTAQFNNDNNNGSGFEFCQAGGIAFTALDTTPSVSGFKNFSTNNSGGATTITNFDGGVTGQHIYVLVDDSNTTFQHNGSTMTLPGAANIVGVDKTIYHFVKNGPVWCVVGGA